MPINNSNVGLSAIQGEFGGVNSISMSEYYRGGGGGYVPSNQSTSPTDGTPIPTGGEIRFGMFRGLAKTASVMVNSFTAESSSESFGTGGALANARFMYDGSMTAVADSYQDVSSKQWYSPITPNIGASYWVYATKGAVDDVPAGTALNSWVSLNTNPIFSFSTGTGNQYIRKSATLTCSIAASAGGPTLATVTLWISATRNGIA